jgi:molybdopterin/thiamine biosynthesis adenylyltransferase
LASTPSRVEVFFWTGDEKRNDRQEPGTRPARAGGPFRAGGRPRRAPGIRVETRVDRLGPDNAAGYFAGVDFAIDATDGAAAKFLLNDTAVLAGVPYSHAGILGFRGQTMTVWPGRSACYRCLFPEAPGEGEVPGCSEAGIVGPVAGLIGSIQAAEAIRVLRGEAPALLGRLLTFDALAVRWRRIAVPRAPDCPACAERPTARKLDAVGEARYGS